MSGIHSLARSSLSHNWRRTWFTLTILVLAGMVMYIQLAASAAQLLSLGAVERLATADAVVLSFLPDSNQRGFRPLKPEVLEVVSNSGHVGAYEALVQRAMRIPTPGRGGVRNYVSALIVDPSPPALSAPRVLSEEGRRLLSISGNLILTDVDARAAGLSLGDEIALNGHALRVAGVVRGALGKDGSMISRATAEAVRRPSSSFRTIAPLSILLKPVSGTTSEQLVREMAVRLAPMGATAITREQFVQDIADQILKDRNDLRDFLVIAGFMGAVTLIIVLQATNSSITAQRTEFGILLALGVPHWRIALLVVEQAIWLGVLSSAFAIAGGLAAQVVLKQLDVALAIQPVFVPLVSGVLIVSTLLGGLAALPGALAIKPVELLR